MASRIEVFERACRSWGLGSRLHPIGKDIADPLQFQREIFDGRIEQLRKLFAPGRSIEIYMDFIDSGRCDAVADVREFLGLVGLTKGSVLLPLDVFSRMFSHPVVLPQIGTASREHRSAQHGDGLPDDYDSLEQRRRRANRSIHATPPLDPARKMLSELLMQLVWKFIAIHELVHIVHGHVDYLGDRHGASYIIEDPTQNGSPQMSLERQAMELWADSKAVTVTLVNLLLGGSHPLVASFTTSPEHRLYWWTFAMFTLFRIFGLQIDPATVAEGNHPPTAMRFQLVMLAAEIDVRQAVPTPANEFWAIVHEAQRDADISLRFLGARQLTVADINGIHDDRSRKHHESLVDCMDMQLRPILQKYAYVDLLPGA